MRSCAAIPTSTAARMPFFLGALCNPSLCDPSHSPIPSSEIVVQYISNRMLPARWDFSVFRHTTLRGRGAMVLGETLRAGRSRFHLQLLHDSALLRGSTMMSTSIQSVELRCDCLNYRPQTRQLQLSRAGASPFVRVHVPEVASSQSQVLETDDSSLRRYVPSESFVIMILFS